MHANCHSTSLQKTVGTWTRLGGGHGGHASHFFRQWGYNMLCTPHFPFRFRIQYIGFTPTCPPHILHKIAPMSGGISDAGNYRPVSLVTIISKLFEHYTEFCLASHHCCPQPTTSLASSQNKVLTCRPRPYIFLLK